MTFCCVPHCCNKSEDGISMRHFPNTERRALWTQKKLIEKIRNLQLMIIHVFVM